MASSTLPSIRSRLTIASLLVLPLICGFFAWTLGNAYSSSLTQAQEREMMQQAYALIAAAEIENSSLWLPEQMTDDRFNQLSSDTFALVINGDKNLPEADRPTLWHSMSTSNKLPSFQWKRLPLSAGQHSFSRVPLASNSYFALQYALEWESELGEVLPFQFVIFENEVARDRQLGEYQTTLWTWLAVIALTLMIVQLAILRWGLRPISSLVSDLSAVKNGKKHRLSGAYPKELSLMTNSINQLIEHEQKQRERYRHTLADLAHSIKNPVAIITSALAQGKNSGLGDEGLNPPWLDDIAEQSARVNQIISYQLTRAVGGSTAPFNKAIALRPICQTLVSALQKVYLEKAMSVTVDISDEAYFRGDEGDLMELLGNLVDNAFKYGERNIQIKAKNDDAHLYLTIEDDGPGMSEREKMQLVGRGERADTVIPGQGIGLAVVSDIVASYHGELLLDASPLGGLKVVLRFTS